MAGEGANRMEVTMLSRFWLWNYVTLCIITQQIYLLIFSPIV